MTALVLAAMVGATVGIWIGALLADRKWREKGNEGWPRKESAGSLYWVNRDDRPCWRCADGSGNKP